MTITLTIGNPAPRIQNLLVFENPLFLTENSQTTVWCNATANDSNGWQDISSASGIIWDVANSNYNSSNDYNNHYTNTSCALSTGSGTDRVVSCAFRVYYHANPGNWTCRITASDSFHSGYNETNFNISTFLGLSTSSEINFGIMSPGSISNSSITTYVNNTCNQEIDILLNTQSNIICSEGTIPSTYAHYNTTNVDYLNMCNLTTFWYETCDQLQRDFNLGKCTTISGTTINPSKNIYWRMRVPYGVSGTCSATLIVTAKES